ncbi:MAG: Rubredoxin-2 [marine bacterium B5-7]|nr:MAG: Rubredoxin-2 [marine bacterium B5-7]
MNIWVCEICDFIYDEAKGIPNDGIPAGTRWRDVPVDWACSYCGATKSAFKMKKLSRVDAIDLSILNP